MKVGMLSPYSLSRPGGVQGQVFGLSRALRKLGHEVTVIGPQDEGATVADENVVVVGRPTGLHSNGSVAPVTISPMVSVRTERFVRHSDFDVLHIHEPRKRGEVLAANLSLFRARHCPHHQRLDLYPHPLHELHKGSIRTHQLLRSSLRCPRHLLLDPLGLRLTCREACRSCTSTK